MLRLILLIAVVAIGADAILNNGAYTQAAWREIASHTLKIEGSGLDTRVGVEKRE